jgi:nitrogen regulatory protein PII
MGEVVPIRDYVDVKIASLRERVDSEKELSLVKEEAKAVALKLQFNETERRLDVLNHEAARLALMIPKEQFDIVVNQMKKEADESKDKIIELQKDKSNREGKVYIIQLIWGLVLLFLGWLINNKFK